MQLSDGKTVLVSQAGRLEPIVKYMPNPVEVEEKKPALFEGDDEEGKEGDKEMKEDTSE